MAIVRIPKINNYTIMSNHHLTDPALNLKAKGLLLRQLYITVICLSKAPAAVLSSVTDAAASPPSSALHPTLYPAHLIGNI